MSKPHHAASFRWGQNWLRNASKKIKTTRFGADGYTDYIKSQKDGKKSADARKSRYLKRHAKEKGGVMTASTLSKKILWNKPTLASSIADYKKTYGLK